MMRRIDGLEFGIVDVKDMLVDWVIQYRVHMNYAGLYYREVVIRVWKGVVWEERTRQYIFAKAVALMSILDGVIEEKYD